MVSLEKPVLGEEAQDPTKEPNVSILISGSPGKSKRKTVPIITGCLTVPADESYEKIFSWNKDATDRRGVRGLLLEGKMLPRQNRMGLLLEGKMLPRQDRMFESASAEAGEEEGKGAVERETVEACSAPDLEVKAVNLKEDSLVEEKISFCFWSARGSAVGEAFQNRGLVCLGSNQKLRGANAEEEGTLHLEYGLNAFSLLRPADLLVLEAGVDGSSLSLAKEYVPLVASKRTSVLLVVDSRDIHVGHNSFLKS